MRFRIKPDIARDLLHGVLQSKRFPAKWVGCDATFGSDWTFLESLPEGLSYFAGIIALLEVEKAVYGGSVTKGLAAPPASGSLPTKRHRVRCP